MGSPCMISCNAATTAYTPSSTAANLYCPSSRLISNSSSTPKLYHHHVSARFTLLGRITLRSKSIICTAQAAAGPSGQSPFLDQAEDHRNHTAPATATNSDEVGDDCSFPGRDAAPTAISRYTSMSADPLAYWDTHKGLLHRPAIDHIVHHDQTVAPPTIAADQYELMHGESGALSLCTAELRLLANAASDRAEMHSILAQQRDNWNKLFQRMLTSTTMTACLLSALAGHVGVLGHTAVSLSLPALLLNAGAAAMMAVINQFQPSQLAEEQRTAARLFRKLASDIHYALNVAPDLRQSTPSFLHDCKRRLRALDKAFPMPLTPGGLEKFPAKVVPPVLMEPDHLQHQPLACSEDDHHVPHQDLARDAVNNDTDLGSHHMNINGWDRQLISDLEHVAATLSRSDIPKYTGWAQNLVKVNKCLAIAAPCFAASAALLNVLGMIHLNIVLPTTTLGMWASICSVLSAFAGSFSNDMQLGMVFELYRNSAGYYADVEASIQETLRTPMEQRENGMLFRQRVAYQLGRWPSSRADPVVPQDAEEAGTLF